jgi:quercetin dioxygenase-like cupin family protein
MSDDPTVSNPDHYRTLWENEFVRVLDYSDVPGTTTTPHVHPNSVMVTLSSFRRLLISGDQQREVELHEGQAVWLDAQEHAGTNIGDTPTHTILIELKGAAAGERSAAALGPVSPGS